MKDQIVVAVAGNPNSGKTTIFNNITGARQHVGNYPGVTVEKKEGHCVHKGVKMTLVDLPGTYSLTAYSVEELIARKFVVDEAPDVVVDIVDASNLERNLYLASQFIELSLPLVVALNMIDVAEQRGVKVDEAKVAELTGCPVVPTVGSRNEGTAALLDAIVHAARGGAATNPERVRYGREIEDEILKITKALPSEMQLRQRPSARWVALKLLEKDEDVTRAVRDLSERPEEAAQAVEGPIAHLERVFGEEPEAIIADRRYGFARGVCLEAETEQGQDRLTRSDHIDKIVCNRLLGPIFFVLAMYVVFQLTFTIGGPLMDCMETLFDWAGTHVGSWWPSGVESPLKSLLVDGVIGGVGGVVVFLPNILLLFLAIAVLEDSGYMARAAFIVDKLMHKIGLHGKSFIPMVIGFGCSVPGIMATRTLDSKRDRLTTLLVLPLMSCSARLPIYALIIPAFFPQRYYAWMLLLIYFIGIALAVVSAKVLRSTLFRGEAVPFVMELPPYRLPTLRGTLIHMWERGWLYLKKAGTLILGASILLWALTSYPRKPGLDLVYDQALAEAEAELGELSSHVNIGDLRDAGSLLETLRAEGPSATPSPSRRIWGMLDAEARGLLLQGSASEEERTRILVKALNALLPRRDLYEAEDFGAVALGREAQDLLASGTNQLSESRVRRLNRLLLADAYPQHIAKGPSRDIKSIAAALGLSPESTTLAEAFRAVREKAGDKRQEALDRLAKRAGDWGKVQAFLDMRGHVLAVRRESDESMAKLEAIQGEARSLQALGLQKRLSEALSVLQEKDPGTYSAVLNFVDEAETPFNARMAALGRARQTEALKYTAAGRVGRALEVALRPLGFDWRIATALIGAFAAKEVFVAQMGIVFSLGDADEGAEGLRKTLQSHYTPLVGLCIMLFTLISAPCMATIAVTKREANSWGWAMFQLCSLTLMAYVVTFIVYQAGCFFEVGIS